MPNGYEAQGLSFRLPQSQARPLAGGATVGTGAAGGFTPLEPEKGLATGVAEEKAYFDQLQDLNSFVENQMAKGIDPTRPTIGEPDSMLANRLYREKLKRTQEQANKLKAVGELQKQRALLEMKGQVLPTQQPTAISQAYGLPTAPSVQQLGQTLTTDLLPAVKAWKDKFAGRELGAKALKSSKIEQAQVEKYVETEAQRKLSQGFSEQEVGQWKELQLASVQPSVRQEYAPRVGRGKKEEGAIVRFEWIEKSQKGHKDVLPNFIDGRHLGKVVSSVDYDKDGNLIFYTVDKKTGDEVTIDTVDSKDFNTLNTIANTIPGQERFSMEDLKKYEKQRMAIAPAKTAEEEAIIKKRISDVQKGVNIENLEDFKTKGIESIEFDKAILTGTDEIDIVFTDGTEETIDLSDPDSFARLRDLYDQASIEKGAPPTEKAAIYNIGGEEFTYEELKGAGWTDAQLEQLEQKE